MSGIDRALARLGNQAEKLNNYDEYEGELNYDEGSGNYNVAGPRGVSRPSQRGNVVVVRSHQNPGRRLDKAQFDINVTRLTNTIASPLPIAIFGTTHSRAAYSNIITPPAGATLVVTGGLNAAAAAVQDRVRFTYTSGANVDSIDITCNQVPYPVFLEAMGADIFRISNIRYQLTNSLDTIQFAQAHKFQSKSLFGKDQSNDISINAYKKPEQFQPGIIDIPIAADIDKETMFIAAIAATATAYPFNFTLSVFVEQFDKHDRLKVR